MIDVGGYEDKTGMVWWAHPDSWVGKLTAVEGIGGRRISTAVIGARGREGKDVLGLVWTSDKEGMIDMVVCPNFHNRVI